MGIPLPSQVSHCHCTMIFSMPPTEGENNELTILDTLALPPPMQQLTSAGSSAPQIVRLESISEDGDTPRLIEDAPYAEEPESLLFPDLPQLNETPSPNINPLPSPPIPDQGTSANNLNSIRRNRKAISINTATYRRTTRGSTGLSTSPRLTSDGLPPKGPLHKPTIHRGLSVATPSATSVAHIDLDDPEALVLIWSIYAREASQADRRMLVSWNRSLDVRLLFSGIFSAILTPFIAESYKLLQNQPHLAYFGQNGYRLRVNAMWFGSLIVSLIAALLSIHCKQWLDGYTVELPSRDPSNSGATLQRACRLRQYRFQGLQRYYIHQVIGLLPVLLYIALLFFSIGLIDFLWHLNKGIAIYISVLCGIVVIFHLFTTIVPFFTTRTPFKTPMSNFLGNLWRGMREGRLAVKGLMEAEELLDVESQGHHLDENCFKWLMKTTELEDHYLFAVRAEREHSKQRRKTPEPV